MSASTVARPDRIVTKNHARVFVTATDSRALMLRAAQIVAKASQTDSNVSLAIGKLINWCAPPIDQQSLKLYKAACAKEGDSPYNVSLLGSEQMLLAVAMYMRLKADLNNQTLEQVGQCFSAGNRILALVTQGLKENASHFFGDLLLEIQQRFSTDPIYATQVRNAFQEMQSLREFLALSLKIISESAPNPPDSGDVCMLARRNADGSEPGDDDGKGKGKGSSSSSTTSSDGVMVNGTVTVSTDDNGNPEVSANGDDWWIPVVIFVGIVILSGGLGGGK